MKRTHEKMDNQSIFSWGHNEKEEEEGGEKEEESR
jgi:hypothetical protein